MKQPLSTIVWGISISLILSFFLPWMKFDFENVMSTYERNLYKQKANIEDTRAWFEQWLLIRPEERKKALEKPFLGYNALALISLLRDKPSGSELRLAILRPHLPFKRDDDKTFFIFSLPLSGLIAVLIIIFSHSRKILLPFPFFICTAQYFIARWHVEEHYVDRMVYDVHVGLGYWITLYALLSLSLILLFKIMKEIFKTSGGE
jgi:hypothetical protein